MATTRARTKENQLKEYLGLVQRFRPLAPSQEEALLERMRAGDTSAQRELVESYLPRVVAWVAPMRGRGMAFDQLIEAGNKALLRGLSATRGQGTLEEALQQRVLHDLDQSLSSS